MTKYVENECPAQLRYFSETGGRIQLISNIKGQSCCRQADIWLASTCSVVSFTTGRVLEASQREWCFSVHMQIDEPRKLNRAKPRSWFDERSCGSQETSDICQIQRGGWWSNLCAWIWSSDGFGCGSLHAGREDANCRVLGQLPPTAHCYYQCVF
jgi:hypothetical protein